MTKLNFVEIRYVGKWTFINIFNNSTAKYTGNIPTAFNTRQMKDTILDIGHKSSLFKELNNYYREYIVGAKTYLFWNILMKKTEFVI